MEVALLHNTFSNEELGMDYQLTDNEVNYEGLIQIRARKQIGAAR